MSYDKPVPQSIFSYKNVGYMYSDYRGSFMFYARGIIDIDCYLSLMLGDKLVLPIYCTRKVDEFIDKYSVIPYHIISISFLRPETTNQDNPGEQENISARGTGCYNILSKAPQPERKHHV